LVDGHAQLHQQQVASEEAQLLKILQEEAQSLVVVCMVASLELDDEVLCLLCFLHLLLLSLLQLPFLFLVLPLLLLL